MQLHEAGLVTEVHLWDFTLRDKVASERRKNRRFIDAKAAQYDFVKIKDPTPSSSRIFPGFSKWKDELWYNFYKYYADNMNANDVLVKVDDDILYVNVSEFGCFTKYVHYEISAFTVSANIVNNGVVAHIQQKLGILPLDLGYLEYPHGGAYGSLWGSANQAYKLHKYFVEHMEDFYHDKLIRYRERLSINLLAYSGRVAQMAYETLRHHGGDEPGLTTYANVVLNVTNVIYMRLVAAHATFHGQSLTEPEKAQAILDLYRKL